MSNKSVLEKLQLAADQHGQDDDPDHTVGDLQGLLGQCWKIMTVTQRVQMLKSNAIENLLLCGARGEFDAESLQAQIQNELADMEQKLKKHGYGICRHAAGYFWGNDAEASGDFYDRADAIESAFKHLTKAAA